MGVLRGLPALLGVAAGMGLLGPRARADDVVIGTVFAWVLGLGALFLSLFTSNQSGANGVGGVRVLFGSIFGLSAGQARRWRTVPASGCASRPAGRPAGG